ncbi:hypothetical protein CLV86_1855 [Lacinutrix venerupis]|uniref:class I lanthipeptide n=1 Tax=Lacinutrix venerupis TaxID=1486034 RepID=UPI000EADDDBE|nr:class I lanthipeptide [Lacinutrix venerupis]RLJ63318.1 hypothetical protein CLV86_1855 [Lacinutrix venerupis]
MKTQSSKLQFDKNSITELNSSESIAVNGGCQWSQSSGPTLTIKISIVADNPSQNDNISF